MWTLTISDMDLARLFTMSTKRNSDPNPTLFNGGLAQQRLLYKEDFRIFNYIINEKFPSLNFDFSRLFASESVLDLAERIISQFWEDSFSSNGKITVKGFPWQSKTLFSFRDSLIVFKMEDRKEHSHKVRHPLSQAFICSIAGCVKTFSCKKT